MTSTNWKLGSYVGIATIVGALIALIAATVTLANAFRDQNDKMTGLERRLDDLTKNIGGRNIPSSAVIFVDTDGCPDGWERSARVAGKVIVAADPSITKDEWGKFGKTGGRINTSFLTYIGDDAGGGDSTLRSFVINGTTLVNGQPMVVENSPPYATLTACEVAAPAK